MLLRAAVRSRSQILDRDNVQCVNGHNQSIAIDDTDGTRGDQNPLRMPNRIFPAVRSANRKRLETAPRCALPELIQIHTKSYSASRGVSKAPLLDHAPKLREEGG